MNLSKVVITMLLAIILASSIVFTVKISNLEKKATELQLQPVKKDVHTVTVIDSSLYFAVSEELETIKVENKKLRKLVKKQKADVKAKIDLVTQLTDSIKSVVIRDSIIINHVTNTYVGIRQFNVVKAPFVIEGFFQKHEPFNISFSKLKAKMNLELLICQTKYGNWVSNIDTKNPNVEVLNLKTVVKPYKKPWYKNLRMGAGVQLGNNFTNIYGIAGYKKYAGTFGFSAHGNVFGLQILF